MARGRTVRRTYWSKKLQAFVTKEYHYAHKSTRGKTLVDKRGRILKKNVGKFEEAIRANQDYSDVEKRSLIADLRAIVAQRHRTGDKLTTTGFIGRQQSNKVARFLANAGYSPEELAEELDIDEEDILDPENWDDDILTVNGMRYKFKFTYTGNFYEAL